MEPLWNPVVATGGKQWQPGSVQKRRKQAITVALGCDWSPIGAHGKEEVVLRSEPGNHHVWPETPLSRTGFRGDLGTRMLSWGEEILRCHVEIEEVPRGVA